MKFDPKIHHRRSIRLKGYDYRQAGGYFVTLVAQGREMLFGEVVNGEMVLNNFGKIVAETWQWLEMQYPYVALGEWVIMPNHFHGIIFIMDDDGRGGSRTAPTTNPQPVPANPQPIPDAAKRKPLGRLIGAFKTVSTKHINIARHTEGATVWQRDFYEHILRNETELDHITSYIESNPARWADDNDDPEHAPIMDN
jgi:REP element-mobilizing transposase RayT